MALTLEELCELMHETYEAAALKHGWTTNPRSRLTWSQVPPENKATMRDAVAAVEEAVRVDERAKRDEFTFQEDLNQIMRALDLSTHARPYSPHEVVHTDILPKIKKLKGTLFKVREVVGTHYVEVRDLLDKG